MLQLKYNNFIIKVLRRLKYQFFFPIYVILIYIFFQIPVIKIFFSKFTRFRIIYAKKLENNSVDFFEDKKFLSSMKSLKRLEKIGLMKAGDYCRLALIYLIYKKENKALKCLRIASENDPFYLNPDLDNSNDPMTVTSNTPFVCDDGLLYAGYYYASIRAYQVGAGNISNELAQRALFKQNIIKYKTKISSELGNFLSKHQLKLDDLRLFPAVWITQIGHIGMLDIMLRMKELNWWQGNAVILVSNDFVANHLFLDIISKYHRAIILKNEEYDLFSNELNNLIRSRGCYFHTFKPPGMPFMRWHEAAAFAMWKEKNNLLFNAGLIKAFDHYLENNLELKNRFETALADWGMGKNDWYVCLHLREPGYYNDKEADRGQGNRNSSLMNYQEAIRFITERGGRVIKMGAKNTPFPIKMPGLIDYPHSLHHDTSLDIALIRHAKFFIGTTSGLANVAMSFGIPTAQVNCITTEFQPWHASTRFCLKLIKRKNGTYLTQQELTSDARWMLATAQTMKAAKLTAEENTPDEILETVKEVYELSFNIQKNNDPMIAQWQASLAAPYVYGAAQLSSYFLRKHGRNFLTNIRESFF